MRVTTQMMNASAKRAGISLGGTSLLNYINTGNTQSTQNALLNALSTKQQNTVSKTQRSSYEKLENSAEKLVESLHAFLAEGEESIFEKACEECAMSDETLNKIEIMDDYVIAHFRVAFGNRIVKHMKKFVPVYVACGGSETEAVDYFLAKKVLRKFEALNLALIRDEIDGYIDFLDKLFGKGAMKECIEFLLRLKKS